MTKFSEALLECDLIRVIGQPIVTSEGSLGDEEAAYVFAQDNRLAGVVGTFKDRDPSRLYIVSARKVYEMTLIAKVTTVFAKYGIYLPMLASHKYGVYFDIQETTC